ncbi:MAG: branched-chain amino acid ABC transporter permease [Pyrodictiaceae archaeon]
MSKARRSYWVRELLAPTPVALYIIIVAMLLVGFFTANLYMKTVAMDLMFWITLAVSMNIIMGFTGYVSFGHVVFVGLGGYMMALLMEYWLRELADQNPLLVAVAGIVLGTLVSVAVAGSIGTVVLRLRGAFFAIATIGLDLTALYLFHELPTKEGGGEIYFSHIPSLDTIYYLTWVVFAVSILSMIVLRKSRIGMGLEAIREDEDAAESLGVPTARYKTIAFMVSAALAGAMGAVYAWRTLSVTPAESFNLIYSVKMIVMVVVGGLGTLLGPVVGGIVYYLLYLYFTTTPALLAIADMIMGLLAILIILFVPRGIIGYLRLLRFKIVGMPIHKVLE